MPTTPETAVSYAALILADEGLEITPDKLHALLQAAGVDIEPIWSTIFCKALQGKDVKQILTAVPPAGRVARVPSGEQAPVPSSPGKDDGVVCCNVDESDSGSDIGLGLFD